MGTGSVAQRSEADVPVPMFVHRRGQARNRARAGVFY